MLEVHLRIGELGLGLGEAGTLDCELCERGGVSRLARLEEVFREHGLIVERAFSLELPGLQAQLGLGALHPRVRRHHAGLGLLDAHQGVGRVDLRHPLPLVDE